MTRLVGCKLDNIGNSELHVIVGMDWTSIKDCDGYELLTKYKSNQWRLGDEVGLVTLNFTRSKVLELFARGDAVDAYLAANPLPEE